MWGQLLFLRQIQLFAWHQYMPPMPPVGSPMGGAGGVGSFLSATRLSVVSTMAAMEAAFCRALRVTLVGSTIPAGIISQYSSL